ncbi:MAG: rod shape-determining protein RodA [Deltaproteobacteria bacterium]
MGTRLRILIIALLICLLGVLSIYSSTLEKGGVWKDIYQKQLMWIAIGVVLYFFFSRFNYRRLWDWMYFIYGLTVFLLFLVFALGIIRLGAQRWLKLFWFSVQPSEVAKLIVLVFLARYFSRKAVDTVSLKNRSLGIFRGVILPFIFVAIPAGLVIEQPDLGSGLMLFILFFIMLFVSNVRMRYLVLIVAIIAAAFPFAWNKLHGYQKERIMVFLNPNADPLGAGYTVVQAKIAIGSGGFFGKGWLAGTQSQLHFLPESHTDFIFSTFTEEWGFMGGLILILLYFLLLREAFSAADRTSDDFGKLLALGIASLLAVQSSINIAMNMGLAPIVGIPLPLMSYGGSSVITTFIALGIVANVHSTRAVF